MDGLQKILLAYQSYFKLTNFLWYQTGDRGVTQRLLIDNNQRFVEMIKIVLNTNIDTLFYHVPVFEEGFQIIENAMGSYLNKETIAKYVQILDIIFTSLKRLLKVIHTNFASDSDIRKVAMRTKLAENIDILCFIILTDTRLLNYDALTFKQMDSKYKYALKYKLLHKILDKLNIERNKFNDVFEFCNGNIIRERGSSVYVCDFVRSQIDKSLSSEERKKEFETRLTAFTKIYGDTKFKLRDYITYYMHGDININDMLGITVLNGIIYYLR